MIPELMSRAVDLLSLPPLPMLERSSSVQPAIIQGAARGSGGVATPANYAEWLALYADLAVVHRCAELNAHNGARATLRLYEYDEATDGLGAVLPPSADQVAGLFARVNDRDTLYDLEVYTFLSLELVGNAYWELVRGPLVQGGRAQLQVGRMLVECVVHDVADGDYASGGGVWLRTARGNIVRAPAAAVSTPVVEIWPLNPGRMTIVPDDFGIKAFTHTVAGRRTTLLPDQVQHLRYVDVNNDFYGVSAIRSAARTLEGMFLIEKVDNAMLKNGARLGGIMSMEREVTPEQINQAMDLFDARYAGVEKAGKIAFIPGGRKLDVVSMTQADMKSLERLRQAKSDIRQVMGVPPIVYGLDVDDQSATRENSAIQERSYYTNKLLPMTGCVERTINEQLMPRLGYGPPRARVAHDFSEHPIVRDLLVEEAKGYAPLAATGVVLPGEIRELLAGRRPRFETLPWGRKWFGGLNLVEIADADTGESAGSEVSLDVAAARGMARVRAALRSGDPLTVERETAALRKVSRALRYSDDQPRDEDGKFSGSGSGSGSSGDNAKRVAAAKASHKPSTRAKQMVGEASEVKVAKMIGGKSLPDNEPMDVLVQVGGKRHAIEVKTFVDNANDKITMHPASLARKTAWARLEKTTLHTVLVDTRPGKRGTFYRRGVGSFRAGTMEKVRDGLHLADLMGA